ncbi:MAG: hypothetical protein NWE89_11165 [Candidatus Bathyarchaeota archaeon]|nr:hypothetical protein [Candidatus Bathyarchaeota archaeon]
MGQNNRDRLRLYFSGASIAVGIPFMLLEVFGMIVGHSPGSTEFQSQYWMLFTGSNFFFGAVAGFLVARRSSIEPMQVGVTTGVLAYLLQQVVYLVYYAGAIPNDLNLTIALVGGTIVGSGAYRYKARIDALNETIDTDIKLDKEQSGEEETLPTEG